MILPFLLAALLTPAGADAPVQVLPAAAIEQQVQAELVQRLSRAGSQALVRIDGRIEDQQLPAGPLQVVVGDIAGRWPRPRVGVPVRLFVGGRPLRSLTVWANLQDERTVLAYATAYPARHPGEQLQMTQARVDMTCCAGSPIGATSELGEARLRRAVRAGQPVMANDFEPMPDVLAQQRVGMVVEHGPVRLVTTGIALRDGHIGEWIDVRSDQSQATVRSRVVAKQKVRVDE